MTTLYIVILVIVSTMSSLMFLSSALLEDKEGFLDKFAGDINALHEYSAENNDKDRKYLIKTILSMFLKGILFPFVILFITFMTGGFLVLYGLH